ncbi:MAG TPA: DNA topoisomerase VI subunit B [Candidatus Nanoarchaeia archaeon]|nr:DNA topoisomerase VI subunit B [Candidatus Nanoarchaeia archaeon]
MAEQQTIAHELAKKQKEIGVAEFFARNRHLLGFDNKRKALLTAVKEAVDNSLDACEEAGILPEISIELIDMTNDRFKVIIEDNGPGIVKEQMGNIFAKLLYGSKFHTLRQARGQQGIGISAAVMYGQLTTGRPAKIKSKIGKDFDAHQVELKLDTKTNSPQFIKEETVKWAKEHGTRVEIDLEASYMKGPASVDAYLKQTAITNPHATIIYTTPKAEQIIFPRAVEQMPPQSKAIKPHPYGVELGYMLEMLQRTESRTLQSFLTQEFSRVGAESAKQICENARLLPNTKPNSLNREQVEMLMEGVKKTKLMAPTTDCICPIGAEQLLKGLKKEVNAEFYDSVSRPPAVYRGNPFVVEAAVAYGGDQPAEESVNILRFANRVPLLYQQGACASTKAITSINFKAYGLSQSEGSMPQGPCTIVLHIASVWVPFTSESKEAIAHYPEIIKEMRLALQEIGRKLSSYIRKKQRVGAENKKRDYIEKFIPHVAQALIELLKLKGTEKKSMEDNLREILEKVRGEREDVGFDEGKNAEFDEEFASIGEQEETPEDD